MGTPGPEPLPLRLSSRDRRGLVWLRRWSRRRLTALKRRLKYGPRQRAFDARERAILSALVHLQQAADILLTLENEVPDGADRD